MERAHENGNVNKKVDLKLGRRGFVGSVLSVSAGLVGSTLLPEMAVAQPAAAPARCGAGA